MEGERIELRSHVRNPLMRLGSPFNGKADFEPRAVPKDRYRLTGARPGFEPALPVYFFSEEPLSVDVFAAGNAAATRSPITAKARS